MDLERKPSGIWGKKANYIAEEETNSPGSELLPSAYPTPRGSFAAKKMRP
jgi:hypothetical protein